MTKGTSLGQQLISVIDCEMWVEGHLRCMIRFMLVFCENITHEPIIYHICISVDQGPDLQKILRFILRLS